MDNYFWLVIVVGLFVLLAYALRILRDQAKATAPQNTSSASSER